MLYKSRLRHFFITIFSTYHTYKGEALLYIFFSHAKNITNLLLIVFNLSSCCSVPDAACDSPGGAMLTDPSGSISSPGYPEGNYGNRQNCQWHITVDENKVCY